MSTNGHKQARTGTNRNECVFDGETIVPGDSHWGWFGGEVRTALSSHGGSQ